MSGPDLVPAGVDPHAVVLGAAAAVTVLLVVTAASRRQPVGNGAGDGLKPFPVTNPQPVLTPAAPKPSTPAPKPSTSPVLAGPAWGSVQAPVVRLSEAELSKRLLWFMLSTGVKTDGTNVARALVRASITAGVPLDLLVGHAWAEGGFGAHMSPNSAGAVGPLQITRICAADVGETYPPRDLDHAALIGAKYLKKLRRSYPEARGSLTALFRMYGMGPGQYRKWIAQGANVCAGACTHPYTVVRAECGCGSHPVNGYTAKIYGMAKKAAPYLHTMNWSEF